MQFLKKNRFVKTYFFTFILILICVSPASCQRQISPQALKAIHYFDSKQFSAAYQQFKLLVDKFPKDPLYHYYLGASMVEINFKADEAIYYLKMANAKKAHPKTSYYIGKAYVQLFRFDEAEASFKEMLVKSKRQEIKELALNEEIKKAVSAKAFYSQGIDIEIIEKTKVSVDSFIYALHQWIIIPEKSNLPALANQSTIYSLPKTTVSEIYYSAPNSQNPGQNDIFKIKKSKDDDGSIPENLGNIINTGLDENYPVYVENEKRLYFASKGHNSTGGYDIYYSTLENGIWSIPEPLPFPINCPWDDFLFISTNGKQLFLSNRENNPGQISIYQIEPFEKAESKTFEKAEDMYQVCFKKARKEKIPVYKNPENTFETIAETKTIKLISSSERIDIISNALTNQRIADSLLLKARKIKLELNNTEGKEQRSNLFSAISKTEKSAVVYQEKANVFYAQTLETNSKSNFRSSKDSVVVKKASNNFVKEKETTYSKENPIPFDIMLPDGVSYRIQLGAFSKPADYARFGGLKPLSAENLQEGKIIKYYVGVFSQFDKAEKALKTVKETGFKEAFIVSYLNSKKIPIERARELEKTY